MKYRLIFLLIIFSVAALPSFVNAQANYEDVVYLKNGSIIHGTIIEQVPNESIKIKTADGNIFVYKMDEISKLTKEEKTSTTPARHRGRDAKDTATRKQHGYTNITELNFATDAGSSGSTTTTNSSGAIIGSSNFGGITDNVSLGLTTINGYLVLPYFSFGAGVGIHVYKGLALIPLFLDLRGNFLDKRTTPFVSLGIGYSYTVQQIASAPIKTAKNETYDKGGFLLNPSLGVKFFVVPKMALNLSIGYRYQKVQLYNNNYTYTSSYMQSNYESHTLGFFNLKFGFTF